MRALSTGDLEAAKARVDIDSLACARATRSGDGASSTCMQDEVGRAAAALDGAREGLARTEAKLERNLAQQTAVARLGRLALEGEDLRGLLHETVTIGRTVLGAALNATIAGSPTGRELRVGSSATGGLPVRIGSQDAPFGPIRAVEFDRGP